MDQPTEKWKGNVHSCVSGYVAFEKSELATSDNRRINAFIDVRMSIAQYVRPFATFQTCSN